MTAFPSFSTDDYRLINASVPLCLLDTCDGGDAQSGELAPAALTIAGGKIRQLVVGSRVAAPAGDDVAAGLPAFDLEGGMIWPVCADLHTHLDKGQTWFCVPNPSGRWQDALALVAKDRENVGAPRTVPRAWISLRCAFVHGTAAVRTDIDRRAGKARSAGRYWRRCATAGRAALPSGCFARLA